METKAEVVQILKAEGLSERRAVDVATRILAVVSRDVEVMDLRETSVPFLAAV